MSATSVVERLVKAINSKIQGSSKGRQSPCRREGLLHLSVPPCGPCSPLHSATVGDRRSV